MTLKDCLDDVCPHCGNGSKYVVKYVREHKDDQEALYQEAIALNKYQMEMLINILLSSSYNIFVPWYKKLLIYANSFRSNDILDYYKESFDKVKID
jgi:hypothetical protein